MKYRDRVQFATNKLAVNNLTKADYLFVLRCQYYFEVSIGETIVCCLTRTALWRFLHWFKQRQISMSNEDKIGSESSVSPMGSVSSFEEVGSPEEVARKHVRILADSTDSEDESESPNAEFAVNPLMKLPSFKRRPLSDTPVTSAWTSPSTSAETSPLNSRESSSLSLQQLNQALLLSQNNSKANGNAFGSSGNSTLPTSPAQHPSDKPQIFGTHNFEDEIAPDANPPEGHENKHKTGGTKPKDSNRLSPSAGSKGGTPFSIDSPSNLSPSASRFFYPKNRPTTIDVPGLTKSKTSPDGLISKNDPGSKLVIVMVGLPATGKSFITNKLSRYLNYSMYYCKVFNVGNTRRRCAKDHGLSEQDSNFFDPTNKENAELRDKWALDTLEELLDYLLEGPGSVGVFDATNTTRKRRKYVLDRIHERNSQLKVLFLESICTDKNLVEKNITLKLFGPDYVGKNPEASLKDFKDRLANYMTAYEPIEDDEDIQYIKMIDVGKKVISYKIEGFLASQTVYYLLNFNLTERQIWITRNGESIDNMFGRIGGDSHLTKRGIQYAKALAKFIDEQRLIFFENEIKSSFQNRTSCPIDQQESLTSNSEDLPHLNDFFVWTSMRKRAIETAQFFNEDDYPMKQMRMLDEISAGDYDGMTYPDIQAKYPEEFAKRQKDKLRYRFPGIGGESYMDVINRLRTVITEVERIEDNVLIVTHRVVARALLGYFMNLSVDIIANLDVPLHCVYCLEPKPYGITWSLWEYQEDTDSFKKIPQSELNTIKVKLGLVHKDRTYSVVPTAPHSAPPTSMSSQATAKTSRTPSDSGHSNFTKPTLNVLEGGGTSISTQNGRGIAPKPKPGAFSKFTMFNSDDEEQPSANKR